MKAQFILRAATAILVAGALGYAAPAKADWYPDQGARVIIADDDHGRGHWDDRRDEDASDEHHHDDEDHDHGHGHSHGHHHGRDHDRDRHIQLEEHDRLVIRDYLGHHRDRWCPPGLRKKHNGCLPPGHVRYEVGTILPRDVHYYVLPTTVVRTLTPLPPQYAYVNAGSDVYVMDRTTRTILDAVTLMNDLQR